jgi:hypothetical protein
MSMILLRNLTIGLFFGLALSMPGAQERPPRVKAKEPTVVTVEGKQDRVAEDQRRAKAQEEKDRNALSKAVHGLGRGVAAVGRGVANWIGGLGDSEEVIPSVEERRRSADRKAQ